MKLIDLQTVSCFALFLFCLVADVSAVRALQKKPLRPHENGGNSDVGPSTIPIVKGGIPTGKTIQSGGDIEACMCDRNLDGTAQCRDAKDVRFGLLDYGYEICITAKTKGTIFTRVEEFGYAQGPQRDVLHANGRMAVAYFGKDWGTGTQRVIMDGHWGSNVMMYNNEGFMWELFKRSVRAFRYPTLKFSGTVIASDVNGEVWDVPFHVDVQVASFRLGAFLREKPRWFRAGSLIVEPDGVNLRRYAGFGVFCVLLLLSLCFALRDLYLLTWFLRWAVGCSNDAVATIPLYLEPVLKPPN